MTGQLSFADWMPEAVPESVKADLRAETDNNEELSAFLWKNARTGVRGYITSGGRSVDFVKSAYGMEGGTAIGGHIFYMGDHVRVTMDGRESKKVTWKQYVNYLVEYSAREKGWSRR